ncbi:carbohydrate esterase family 16 protein [Tulasnella calospora MUT 4182]|uniref:Carbohydrate esterase family 16 protein n=1 Tax=Tulasnella calospora MUT 4182 TaxID=1051891 RepID=A0A0C3Q879_9AGAM|nr:carbohydrate esterase family 16 protein [Tulasnella calospora MUT 4182]
MQSPTQTTKRELGDALYGPARFETGNILSLPNELLFRVISFLSTGSIRNLMVNRSLRLICEKGLYQSISLSRHPRRSFRLIQTLLLRPDLALLIRDLKIDLGWLHHRPHTPGHVPSTLQPDAPAALLLAKHIQSLSLFGVGDWIWGPDKEALRGVIFKMKLVRLDLPWLHDPHTLYACIMTINGPGRNIGNDWKGDLGDEIRRLLQAQPSLEEFNLPSTSITLKTSSSLQASLRPSDIPNLRSLQATPEVAIAFLPAAAQLKSLNLVVADWNDRLFSEFEAKSAAIRLFIRHFKIRVAYYSRDHQWFWKNLDKIFSLFSNTEQLSVTICCGSLPIAKYVKPAQYYFDMIAENVSVLPWLRKAEVQFQALDRDTPGILEVETQSLLKFRIACSLLETVVDPRKRLWAFRVDHQNARGFAPQLLGQLIEKQPEPGEDLPAREENES